MKLKKNKKVTIQDVELAFKEDYDFYTKQDLKCDKPYCNYLLVGEQTAKILREKYGWS